MNLRPIILDLCGGSGAWSRPYAEAGYDVRIIDPASESGDVRLMQYHDEPVQGILAAPPCTTFAGSGARWWKGKGESDLLGGLSVVDACLRVVTLCQPEWWVLENPVGRLRRFLGPPVESFNPCDYGDPYTKRTQLWGSFVMPVMAPVEATEGSKIHLYPPGPDRAALRSITPPGFARAFFEANP